PSFRGRTTVCAVPRLDAEPRSLNRVAAMLDVHRIGINAELSQRPALASANATVATDVIPRRFLRLSDQAQLGIDHQSLLERPPFRGNLAHRCRLCAGVDTFKPRQGFLIPSLPAVREADSIPTTFFVVVEGQSALVFHQSLFVPTGAGQGEGKPVVA